MTTTTWETLATESKFCPHALAALCHVSLRTLQRRFDRTYGMPVGQWMRQVRLAQAYGRIAAGESVKSVAYDLHFKQLSHFSRVFKEVYGVAPTLVSPRAHRKTAAGQPGAANVAGVSTQVALPAVEPQTTETLDAGQAAYAA